MTDWDTLLDMAARHVPERHATTTMYLEELQRIVGTPVQNWTDPFGRGYQYEFILNEEPEEVSLIVELSSIASVAAVYLCRRTVGPDGSKYDECGDALDNMDGGDAAKRVRSFLKKHSYDVLPYPEINVVRRGKSTYRWLFNDPED
jgi:hypothetical protein